jgi:uncharacterized protein (TIGR03032 family)
MAPLVAPVFVVGASPAGADALVAALAQASGVWHVPAGSVEAVVAGASAGAGRALDALTAVLVDRTEEPPTGDEPEIVAVAGGEAVGRSAGLLADAFPRATFVVVDGDAGGVPADRRIATSQDALLDDPPGELRRLCAALGVPYDQALLGPVEQLRRAERRGPDEPLGSASTVSFGQLLQAHGASLLVSTYQTNKLVVARAREGVLNTHFRDFDKPMGLAVSGDRVALGTRTEVWDLRDMPAVAPKLEPANTHDACFLPRNRHITGDIAVHELGFGKDDELWLVATGFSCLATLDADHSFVPRWKPPFVSKLTPGDRCHLNGMEIVDGVPRYVTALGRTDEPGGWRAGKATGGVLLDVPTSEEVVGGLSMPHSPRWYDGQLWVLESGKGELCRVDLDAGRTETVAELPGFTRGMSFAGRTAFVGLSQIRESSTFGDLPLTHRLQERLCGVWMVNLDTGSVEGFLRFDDLVQEVFDVALLPGRRWPEVAEPRSTAVSTSYVLP